MHPREAHLVSVVVPLLDEVGSVGGLATRVAEVLEARAVAHELILVDDGSTDGTPEALAQLARDDERVKVVELSRRFGHQAALTAGMDHARGDVVITMDGDLQDPPELIPSLLDLWAGGADVVHAVRATRAGETRAKRMTASVFYRVLQRLSPVPLQADAGDFRLLDRRAADLLAALPERNRYLRGLSSWIGLTQATVPYDRAARTSGTTKFPLGAMLGFAVDAVTAFSRAPLRWAAVIGFGMATLSFLAIPATVAMRVADQFVPGVTTTIIAVLLLGGIQLMALGVIGEYLGRIYDEVKGRPVYVVRARRNVGEDDAP